MSRRLSELERRFATHRDEQGRSIVEAMRQRRRRRMEAEGRPFVERSKQEYFDAGDQTRTVAQVIRAAQMRRAV